MDTTFRTLANQLSSRVSAYRGQQLDVLATEAGVSIHWLKLFKNGRAKNPTIDSLDKTRIALERLERVK